jgi:hypothetical protein
VLSGEIREEVPVVTAVPQELSNLPPLAGKLHFHRPGLVGDLGRSPCSRRGSPRRSTAARWLFIPRNSLARVAVLDFRGVAALDALGVNDQEDGLLLRPSGERRRRNDGRAQSNRQIRWAGFRSPLRVELLHEFVGFHAAEDAGVGDEEDFAEVVEGVAAIARVLDHFKGTETCGEALRVVGFVGISWHPGSVKPLDAVVQIYMPLGLDSP